MSHGKCGACDCRVHERAAHRLRIWSFGPARCDCASRPDESGARGVANRDFEKQLFLGSSWVVLGTIVDPDPGSDHQPDTARSSESGWSKWLAARTTEDGTTGDESGEAQNKRGRSDRSAIADNEGDGDGKCGGEHGCGDARGSRLRLHGSSLLVRPSSRVMARRRRPFHDGTLIGLEDVTTVGPFAATLTAASITAMRNWPSPLPFSITA